MTASEKVFVLDVMDELGKRAHALVKPARKLEQLLKAGARHESLRAPAKDNAVQGLVGSSAAVKSVIEKYRLGVPVFAADTRSCDTAIKALDVFKYDEVIVRSVIFFLTALCKQSTAACDRALALNGRDLVAQACAVHKRAEPLPPAAPRRAAPSRDDAFLSRDGPMLRQVLEQRAAAVAAADLKWMRMQVCLCSKCKLMLDQQPVETSDNTPRNTPRSTEKASASASGARIAPVEEALEEGSWIAPKSPASEASGGGECSREGDPVPGEMRRIERVMRHLKKYPTVAVVADPCVDAFIALGKGSIPAAVAGSGCLPLLVNAMEAFASDRAIVWKGLLAVAHLARNDEMCSDLDMMCNNQLAVDAYNGLWVHPLQALAFASAVHRSEVRDSHVHYRPSAHAQDCCHSARKAGVVPMLMQLWESWKSDEEIRQLVLFALGPISTLEQNQLRCRNCRVAAALRPVFELDPVIAGESASAGPNVMLKQLQEVLRCRLPPPLCPMRAGASAAPPANTPPTPPPHRYCIPLALKRAYLDKALGSPFAKEDGGSAEQHTENQAQVARMYALPPKYGRAGESWKDGQQGLVD
ncbi:hypothetical protein JKP88DRAFT_321945 [Tribonema minus]|uniref:Uncharacterized protein n=1 Tax=Tribonema minus TaxID=303371 RepID=A0A835YWK4_9STRA|nr:hypothetical protein JKP88DRAFT_321945 [Tribonema minus]